MGDPARNAVILLGESTKKRISIALIACTLALGVFLVALLIFTPTAEAQNQRVVTVSIRDFFFEPAQLNIAPGTTVRWVNEGNHPHTVTANDRSFDSERLNPGQSFQVTFRNPGTFAYFCEIHPFMTGSVTVSGGGRGAAASGSQAKAGGVQAKAGSAQAKAGGGGGASMQQSSAKASATGGQRRLPFTGGPSLVLPVALLLSGLLGSGALGLVVLRRLRRASSS